MNSTLNLTQIDPHTDPHDHVLVARVAEEFSELAHEASSRASDPQMTASDFSAGPSVFPVDTTFRAAAVNDGQIQKPVPGDGPSLGTRAIRAFIGFLMALCIGTAAVVWQSYGDAARQVIAKWTPQFVLTSSPSPENAALPEQPGPTAVQASAQTATAALAPAPAAQPAETAPSLQSLAGDLANAGQEIAQLKASIEQLKAGQEQMSRDIAKASEIKVSEIKASQAKAELRVSEIRASEQNLRPRLSTPSRRWAAAPPHRSPPPLYPAPQTASSVPALPPAVAPPVPQQAEAQPLVTRQPEAELIPRPPMPVR